MVMATELSTLGNHPDAVLGALRPLPLLLDPAEYQPITLDYTVNNSRHAEHPVGLPEWIEVFRAAMPTYRQHASKDPEVPEAIRQDRVEQFAQEFEGILAAVLQDPTAEVPSYCIPPVNCITMCKARERCLMRAGFRDIFKRVKEQENATALQLLPSVLSTLDAIQDPGERLEAVLRGVFAGNLFDLGAAASAAQYETGGMSFLDTLEKLLPRPWVVDDLDAVLARFANQTPHNKAMLFCDNAGADIVLGMLPFARELLQRGTMVVLAANHLPSINDITAAELVNVVQAAGNVDPVLGRALKEGSLKVVDSGSDICVIDLSQISEQLAQEALDTDLVVLEGMGRSIETNLHARFTCESLNLGMIKHPEVAWCLGGRLYDIVCRYQPAVQPQQRS